MKTYSLSPMLLLCAAALSTACVDPDDDPSQVHDLRVLGMALNPPELMAPGCEPTPEAQVALGQQVTLSVLVVDPTGEGRPLAWELTACADPEDFECQTAGERVPVSSGSTSAGELSIAVRPGTLALTDGTPLMLKVVEKDPYRGLGGVWMPLSLHLRADNGEEIYAQKLMVFSCPRVPGMTQNRNPEPPGLRLQGAPWDVEALPELHGEGPFEVEAEDFSAREEAYVVAGLDLEPVQLQESWKISWHASAGKFDRLETGGSDLGGQEGRHRTEWEPPERGEAQEVTFWAVVRDGRGGQSWLARRARWVP